MENLPELVSVIFILTTLMAVYIFYRATGRSLIFLYVAGTWMTLQGFIAYYGFYKDTVQVPPRFLLLVLPPLLAIIIFFLTIKGRKYIDRLDARTLTLLHIIRIPVELVLFWLFVYKKVPELMTFEGRNLDILSGITAPFVWYFGYIVKRIPAKFILVWNVICLLLLSNIVVHAILSAPFRFQQLAFEQPNIAVLYFPFAWLPGCIVPLVLFAHLICIRQLTIHRV